ncbi:GNAT family N-acetyltransferase [Tropicimonas sp. IMCC34011]|uniref:GNAT family N-acetyltransferase n=1 Tax=Tropicimonas sp. IMCC34011 TaxID=2248759 RepID=UPI000E2748BF|nr:GNAT family protein [Tropicimonas sp. IMCC34011]
MITRPVTPTDAPRISTMLQAHVAAGKRSSPADEAFVLERYIDDPARIACTLAEDDAGSLLGFQSLTLAAEGNPYGTPAGWGIIGTHVAPGAGRGGVGSRLFEVTQAVGLEVGLRDIEAVIGVRNVEGQAYYEKMGFITHRLEGDAIAKRYRYGR